MNGNKKWYAVYTSTNCEKKVSGILTRKNIENYCPQTMAKEPLFKSYVFVRISETNLLSLKKIPGVINLVYWLGKPAVIQDAEIEIIKRVLDEYINAKLERASKEPVTRQVQVFAMNNSVRITLPSLGYMIMAETNTENEILPIGNMADQTDVLYPVYVVNQ